MLHKQAEEELLEAGLARLNELLGADWGVQSVTAPRLSKTKVRTRSSLSVIPQMRSQ